MDGGGLDSGAGNEISGMQVEQDEMEVQLEGNWDGAGVESTPETQEGRTAAPQTAERVEIPKLAEGTTGKEFLTQGRSPAETRSAEGPPQRRLRCDRSAS